MSTRRIWLAAPLLRALWRFAGAVALTAAVTFVVVIGPAGLPRGDDRALVGWFLLAGLLIAVLAPVVHHRFGEQVDRMTATAHAASDRPLTDFAGRLTRAVPLDELLLQLTEVIVSGFARRRAEVWLTDGEVLSWTTGVPHRQPPPLRLDDRARAIIARSGVSGPAWADVWLPLFAEAARDGTEGGDRVRYVPLAHRGRLLGLLVVERGVAEPPFGERDEQALDRLAHQLAVALHNVELDAALQRSVAELRRRNAELQDSRARLVSVADGERRRLERDLHDGAQQHLTAVSVKLRLAQSLARTAPDAAGPVLAEVLADLDAAKEQLRSLAHGIFPPQLTIGGLREALATVAARASLPVSVDLGDVQRYVPGVEAAVYFCCLEAVHNASKHAGPGASAVIRLRQQQRELRFEVADNGGGFAGWASGGRGQGLANMADRLGAIGGELTVTSTPGAGTTVAGRIPLPADRAPAAGQAAASAPSDTSSSA